MARPTKEPQLKQHKDGRWYIYYLGKQYYTGDREDDGQERARKALARFVAKTYLGRSPEPVVPALHQDTSIDDILANYLATMRKTMREPDRQRYAVIALMDYWSEKTCLDITEDACIDYAENRSSQSTARRELAVLRAALNAAKGKLIASVPPVWLPPEGDPRPDWLTRDEVARLLWQLRRRKKTRHAARFVICMFYTGSRPGTIARSTWEETPFNPWPDLEKGVWNRKGAKEPPSPKKRLPHAIPDRLMFHLKLWRRVMERNAEAGKGAIQTYVIEHPRHRGQPVKNINKALETACRKAGIDRITKHGLKHSAITNSIQSGMSIEDAADYYSTSARTIESTYWHHSPFHQERAVTIANRPGKRV